MLVDSTVESFEELMASFPRRIIFMSNGSDVNGLLLRINSNRMFTDYETVRDYYLALKQFHEETYANAPDGFKSGWFISIAFALYDLQYQLITGTYSSLVASMGIALIILLLTSGKLLLPFNREHNKQGGKIPLLPPCKAATVFHFKDFQSSKN